MQHPETTVSFDAQGLRLDTAQDAEIICRALEGKQIQVLILQGNTFAIEAAEVVGIALSTQSALREAHFKDIFTSRGRDEVPTAMAHLLRGIVNSGAQLTLLDLSDNAIGPIGAPSVIEFLESPSAETIERLYLNNCGLGPQGSSSIAPHIAQLTSLTELIIGRNRLEYEGSASISNALTNINTLQVFKVNQNGIKKDGIANLVPGLKANIKTLREIDISDNTIMLEGANALAEFISKAKNLRSLRLDDALLKNDGFKVICDALSKSPSLRELQTVSFEGNELRGPKIVDLIEATFEPCFSDNPRLTLDLLDNEFRPAELERIENLGSEDRSKRINILVDEPDIDSCSGSDYDDDGTEEDEEEEHEEDEHEEGEICDSGSNGFVTIEDVEEEMREVALEFIEANSGGQPFEPTVRSTFNQMISVGNKPNDDPASFRAVQILCEELGLMKCEETRKKKALQREAIIYIGKNIKDLPPVFKGFFKAVVRNNDELSCGKILFDEF